MDSVIRLRTDALRGPNKQFRSTNTAGHSMEHLYNINNIIIKKEQQINTLTNLVHL